MVTSEFQPLVGHKRGFANNKRVIVSHRSFFLDTRDFVSVNLQIRLEQRPSKGNKMIQKLALGIAVIFGSLSTLAMAQDLTGTWQQIDDKTGSPKAVIEIRKEANQTYTGKIVKVTPRPGYTPRELCNKCPAPYTDQPILGMDILKGLKQVKDSNNYEKGRVIDPLAGRIYDAKIRLNSTGKRLTLRAYMGVSTLGRSQTWIRIQ